MHHLILMGLTLAAAGFRSTPAPAAERTEKIVAAAPSSAPSKESDTVAAPVGTTPPEWQAERWLNSPPLTLAGLRGKVVLVRWWTSGCPYCSTTAPALRDLHRTDGQRGLVVVGMYHHKGAGAFDPSVYEETAKKYGFTFPLAFDPEWRTLKSWMRGVDDGWTSVTFLLDKKGAVRYFHPGGQYEPGDAEYGKITATIERLLAER